MTPLIATIITGLFLGFVCTTLWLDEFADVGPKLTVTITCFIMTILSYFIYQAILSSSNHIYLIFI